MKDGGKKKGRREGRGREREEGKDKEKEDINLILLSLYPPFSEDPSVYHCFSKGIWPRSSIPTTTKDTKDCNTISGMGG